MSAPSSEWLVRQCDHCELPAIIVEPGAEEVRELFLLKRGQPVRCWCLACWVQRFGELAA
jgi:hypothetical protein